MSGLVPRLEELGTFEVETVLDWYDAPILYTVVNELGLRYLGMAVQNDSVVFIQISEDRLVSLRTGLISVLDAFADPERPGALVVDSTQRTVRLDAVPKEYLPSGHLHLSETVDTSPTFSTDVLAQMARGQARPLFALELKPPRTRRTEMSLRDEAEIKYEFQELFSVARKKNRRATAESARDRELVTAGQMAGSFVILLGTSDEGRLSAAPSDALADIQELLNALNSDAAELTAALAQYTKRTRIRLRRFLSALSDAETGLDLFGATAQGQVSHSAATLDGIRDGVSVLRERLSPESQPIEVTGHLTAIDHGRLSFKLREDRATGSRKRPRTFRGKIEPHLRSKIDGMRSGLSIIYKATLIEDIETLEWDDTAEKKTYRLDEIDPLTQG
jgi:hypothetical protein